MNNVNPKTLLHSKFTKQIITNKEKHFTITKVEFDDEKRVIQCVIQAVITNNEYNIEWRELKDSSKWKIGWK